MAPAIKRRWNVLKEYESCNDGLYFISGKNSNGKRVVLEYDVFNVIAHVHDALQ